MDPQNPCLSQHGARDSSQSLHGAMEQNKSQQDSPQPSKSTKNPSKIHPKPSQNQPSEKDASKTRPKINFCASWALFGEFLESPRDSVLNFGRFSVPPGPPKMGLNHFKNAKQSPLQTIIFSNTIFHRFSIAFLRPKP